MASTLKADRSNKMAPFGLDDSGYPYAPYGLKRDGNPRLTAGGRPAADTVPAAAAAAGEPPKLKPLDEVGKKRVAALVDGADMLAVGAVALAQWEPAIKRVGERHAMGIAGNAVILQQFAPGLAEGVVRWAETKPGMLGWLDGMQENTPALMLALTAGQMVKAMVQQQLSPDIRLARAGVLMGRIRAVQLAQQIEDQAKAMGITIDGSDGQEQQQAAA
jgi:hypothetical protein